MGRIIGFVALIGISLFSLASAQADEPTLAAPKVALSGIGFEVTVTNIGEAHDLILVAGGRTYPVIQTEGAGIVKGVKITEGPALLSLQTGLGEELARSSMPLLPGWLSLLPSFLAIIVALIFRQVIPALFVGLWSGAALSYGFSLDGLWYGFFDIFSVYILAALTDGGHVSIIVFSLLIAGLVGVITQNGGMMGVVEMVAKFAHTRRRGQLSTAFLGTAIFFDDYANTLVVGNAMRPITDRLKVSREKLAYIVDSTAAPVASLALITTWIGFQVGLIDQALQNIEGLEGSAYTIFLNSIPYAFYSILALFFVYLVGLTGRDFGPMLEAEKRAMGLDHEEVELDVTFIDGDPKPKARFALIPLAILLGGTFIGIYVTGRNGASDQSFQDIVGAGDPYLAMIWASALAVLVAIMMSLATKRLALGEAMDALVEGMKTLVFAVLVLALAWALAGANETIHTADYLSAMLAGSLSPALLPVMIFLISAVMAFATGSSWGVMGIVIPLAVPLTWAVISGSPGDATALHILYASVAAVLSGAVWGDHCSPISDTTILSSMASHCDHIEHVRTQLPYAMVVALVAIIFGSLPAGFGVPAYLSLLFGGFFLWAFLHFFGKHS
ncbi:MAG: Na+/H+ antiporter NhaC family protein [Alphaproteobacteria bacterium]|nr:MAG: Na+/H+ antiporter NhaC family protein [Alphaproteobacteria bacterium]